MKRLVPLYVLGIAALVALAFVAGAAVDDPSEQAAPLGPRADGGAEAGAPPTTDPPLFAPLPSRWWPRAIRTSTGLVLPVTGGQHPAWEVRTPCADTAAVEGVAVSGAHVVLDPGHGGHDPGAVAPSGQLEKDVNLDIAQRVAAELRSLGAVVELTRDDDVRMAIRTRAELAVALEPLAFVSIHHNAGALHRSSEPGSEVYHHVADPESERLARLLWEELRTGLAPFADDWAAGENPGARARQLAGGADFYAVLRGSQGVPGVLSEAAYLSDPQEDALLATDEFRRAEADAIVDAVVEFATTAEPDVGPDAPPTTDGSAQNGRRPGCEEPPLG